MNKMLLLTIQIILGVVPASWSVVAFRNLNLVIILLAMFVALVPNIKRKTLLVTVVLVVAIISPLQPYDISFRTWAGSPKFVPFITGLQRDRKLMLEKQEKGELVLGSDIVSGFEPKWVVVW